MDNSELFLQELTRVSELQDKPVTPLAPLQLFGLLPTVSPAHGRAARATAHDHPVRNGHTRACWCWHKRYLLLSLSCTRCFLILRGYTFAIVAVAVFGLRVMLRAVLRVVLRFVLRFALRFVLRFVLR
jgi:hypothetical protein